MVNHGDPCVSGSVDTQYLSESRTEFFFIYIHMLSSRLGFVGRRSSCFLRPTKLVRNMSFKQAPHK